MQDWIIHKKIRSTEKNEVLKKQKNNPKAPFHLSFFTHWLFSQTEKDSVKNEGEAWEKRGGSFYT